MTGEDLEAAKQKVDDVSDSQVRDVCKREWHVGSHRF